MLAALDPGSVRAGLAIGRERLDVPPLFDVDAADLAAVVPRIMAALDGVDGLLVERGRLWIPHGVSDAAKQRMAENWSVCERLCDRIADACAAREPPIAVRFVARATWAARLLRAASLPGAPRGDPQVREALRVLLPPEDFARCIGPDRADAVGLLVYGLLPEPVRVPGAKAPLSDDAKARHRVYCALAARRKVDAKRAAAGLPPKRWRPYGVPDPLDVLLGLGTPGTP